MRFRMALGSLLTAVIVWSWATSAAADDHISGVVTGRVDSNTVWVQTEGIGRILVTVSEGTDVRETSGVIRRATASAEELIPGLQVSIDGKYETPDKFIAKKVTFSKEAREIAGAIQAGVTAAANGQRLTAASGRVSNLDNLTSVKTITVHFANGSYDISKAQKAQLEELAAQAQGLRGYVISVAAYTSAIGSGPLNQRLSRQRADAVTTILNQAGVPLMNVLVPAAMSVSEQLAANTTAKGQAENRRAVVTLLQNKGATGHQ
jgi:outer membrane protein OmpA-like peptidoglycan-associated protein